MKIAKPTNEDIDKSFELLRALRILSYDLNPFEKQDNDEIGEPDEPPPLKDSDKSAALDQVIDLYNECNITFLLLTLNTLISPENQVIDQDSDTLDFSQKIKQHEQDSKRLDWLFKNGMSKFSKEIAFGSIVNDSNFRDEIDRIMQEEQHTKGK